MYLDKIAMYGFNLFLRDVNPNTDFRMDFIVYINDTPYYMYVERIQKTDGNFIFNLKPIIKIIEDNNFTYDNIFIANTYRCTVYLYFS